MVGEDSAARYSMSKKRRTERVCKRLFRVPENAMGLSTTVPNAVVSSSMLEARATIDWREFSLQSDVSEYADIGA